MEVTIGSSVERALVRRSRLQPTGSRVSHVSSPYVHRDLRNINNTNMSLAELCEKIHNVAALDKLKVVASECYVSRTLVRHRYLLLELRFRRETVWLRLDRRRSITNILPFILASSRGPANDTVAISLEKLNLIDLDSTQENRQECNTRTITLGEMGHYFALLVRELRHYQLFDANCWLFTGAIQLYLQNHAGATITFGRFVKSDWALKTKSRVMNALEKLYCVEISTTPLLLTDIEDRLEACTRHPRFTSEEQAHIIPVFKKGIETLKSEYALNQGEIFDNLALGLTLRGAMANHMYLVPDFIQACLAEIAIILAKSCRSLFLALSQALNVKAQCLRLSGAHTESRSVLRESFLLISDCRSQPLLVQQYRKACQLNSPWDLFHLGKSELAKDVESIHVLGIETERRLLAMSPSSCVRHLIRELGGFIRHLHRHYRDDEVSDIHLEILQLANSCRCDPQCDYNPQAHSIHSLPRAICILSYAQHLRFLPRTDESLELHLVAINVAPPDNAHVFLEEYSKALQNAGFVEESYNVLRMCVDKALTRLGKKPWVNLARMTKALYRHPHILENHDLQLSIILEALPWLKRPKNSDDASEEREVLWDYANILVIAGRYEAAEEVFIELVGIWRTAYEAEWRDRRPVLVDQWYFVVLDTYAKVLDANGKAEESRTARDMADRLSLKETFSAPGCVTKLHFPVWWIHRDEDDPQYPPQLSYYDERYHALRPAAVISPKAITQVPPTALIAT